MIDKEIICFYNIYELDKAKSQSIMKIKIHILKIFEIYWQIPLKKMMFNSKTESVVDKNIIIIYKDNDKTYLDISLTEIRILPVNMTF